MRLSLHACLLFGYVCLLAAGPVWAAEEAGQEVVVQPRILAVYPHDPDAFTQGLTIHEGRLYEGTGLRGESSLRLVDLDSGEVLQRHNLAERYFGEGIAVLGERIYQLTWQENTVFVYDLESFELLNSFYLPGEGWGITHDGEHLIVSDGSANLRFLEPESGKEVRRVQVQSRLGPIDRLNELEFIKGEVWANVWYEDFIVRINPDNGRVTGWLDLRALYTERSSRDDVLNGIAWDAQQQALYVTGKRWPNLYRIAVPGVTGRVAEP